MASTLRQLLPQFLIMMLLYFVLVAVLAAAGVEGFLPRIIVALVVAFGYPAALRQMGREPPAWQRES
jgi:cell division protein FtsB